MNPRFVMVSRWRLGSPRERIWQLLDEVEEWPSWWPHLEAVERLGPEAAGGVGARHRFRWNSGLGYGFSIVMTTLRAERPRELEGRADGDLRGTGLWLLEEDGPEATRLAYRWDVELARPWMRLLAPLLRPVFARRHFAVMTAGARGMARRLGCDVATEEEWSTVAPRAAGPVEAGSARDGPGAPESWRGGPPRHLPPVEGTESAGRTPGAGPEPTQAPPVKGNVTRLPGGRPPS